MGPEGVHRYVLRSGTGPTPATVRGGCSEEHTNAYQLCPTFCELDL